MWILLINRACWPKALEEELPKPHDPQSHRARLCKNDSNWPSSNQLKEFREQNSDKKLTVSQRIQVNSSNFLNVGPLSPSKPLTTTAHHGLVDEFIAARKGIWPSKKSLDMKVKCSKMKPKSQKSKIPWISLSLSLSYRGGAISWSFDIFVRSRRKIWKQDEISVRITMWNNMDSSNCHQPSMDANASVRITNVHAWGAKGLHLKKLRGFLKCCIWRQFVCPFQGCLFGFLHLTSVSRNFFSDYRVEVWSWVLKVAFFCPCTLLWFWDDLFWFYLQIWTAKTTVSYSS